jgi:hypothetical protein
MLAYMWPKLMLQHPRNAGRSRVSPNARNGMASLCCLLRPAPNACVFDAALTFVHPPRGLGNGGGMPH